MTHRRLRRALAVTALAFAAAAATITPATSPPSAAASPIPSSTASPRWTWPVTVPIVSRTYLAPAQRWSAGHRGVDLVADVGSAVLAPDHGVVHFAGTVVDRPVLSIRHSGGLLSSLEPVSTQLTAGDRVRRGEVVGVVAEPGGHCGERCLHLGARLDGEYVSPSMLLGGVAPSVLLPTRAAP